MLTPVLEILLYLSAAFLLGLTLGWVLWYLSSKQEISAIVSERDFWRNRYERERLQSGSRQGLEEEDDEPIGRVRSRPTSRTSRPT